MIIYKIATLWGEKKSQSEWLKLKRFMISLTKIISQQLKNILLIMFKQQNSIK